MYVCMYVYMYICIYVCMYEDGWDIYIPSVDGGITRQSVCIFAYWSEVDVCIYMYVCWFALIGITTTGLI